MRQITSISSHNATTLRHKGLQPVIIVGKESLVLLFICVRLLLQIVQRCAGTGGHFICHLLGATGV